MTDRIHYSECPVCASFDLKNVFLVKDYTVSGERFSIVECSRCSLRITQDVPGPASIGPYYQSEDYISHTDTSKGLVNRLYKRIRKSTIRKKRKLIENFTGLSRGRLLDVGSGSGAFVNEMAVAGWEVTGLEPDEKARQMASQLHGLTLQDLSAFYQLPHGSFDAITLWHVLEHVHDLPAYMRQLGNLLTEKGKLFIAVPNYTSRDAKIYGEYWAAWDVPRHLFHFSPPAMEWLMKKQGLELMQCQQMWYDSFYISLLSSRYKNGKTNWIAAFWNGLRSNSNAISQPEKCSSVIYMAGKKG